MSCWDGLTDWPWLTHWEFGTGWSIYRPTISMVKKSPPEFSGLYIPIKAKVNWGNSFATCLSLTEEGKNVNTLKQYPLSSTTDA